MNKVVIIFSVVAVFAACNTSKKNEPQEETNKMQQEAMDETPAFSNIQFASAKDTICDMSVANGAADTLHYNGNVYGFCSTECKNEFADLLVSQNKR